MLNNMYSASSLLERAKDIIKTEYHIPESGFICPDYVSGPKYEKWVNDLQIMQTMLPNECPLKDKLANEKYYKNEYASTIKEIIGILESLIEWESYYGGNHTMREGKKYDVFISHASVDKSEYVEELYQVLNMLGISIFYDTVSLSWGDNWKSKILNGTAASEFAIIVISENFFDREWTEIELTEFFNRQNANGQKIVLPLLHKISVEDMKKHYPYLAEIQAINTEKYTKEEVAMLFAKELIKRLKEVQ